MERPDVNRRHTGARKLEAHPEIREPDPVHTGDRGDEPKLPYGLTESLGDRGPATRHHDGTQPVDQEPAADAVDAERTVLSHRPL